MSYQPDARRRGSFALPRKARLTVSAVVALCGCTASSPRASVHSEPSTQLAPRSKPPTPAATDAPVVEKVDVPQSEPETTVCEELMYRCYRPVTMAELTSGDLSHGRVAVTLISQKHQRCDPCPRRVPCEPCVDTTVFTEAGDRHPNAPYVVLFSGKLPKVPHRLFLCLDEGYARHINRGPGDPGAAAIHLEGAIPVAKLPVHPEPHVSEVAVFRRETCQHSYVSSSVPSERSANADLATIATIETLSPIDEPLNPEITYSVTLRVREVLRGTAPKVVLRCTYRVESERRSLPRDEPMVAAIASDGENCHLEGLWPLSYREWFLPPRSPTR